MENLEWILSLAGTAVVLLSAVIGFVIKLVKAIREKDAEKVKNLLLEAAREAVEFAEQIKGLDGAAKKTVALQEIDRKLAAGGMPYDEQAASDAIERLIALSKAVNAEASH